ncbi:hypothetical protein SY83_03035 [Paenibacillus swuensis]|uniref:AraC family transcriptional regulator n=1 Tax=Paenibacillus swuensis TaxID=1178515 RepID=A0A172TEY6_9BACL|nr:response regulator [Paenibacillus swuensis]ANE45464.1 hypothetical protein SY83_03035 [Paenibacillus swuensis]
MYSLLMVDDEAYVVDSLAVTIPWADLDVSQVFKAYSANEALLIMEQHTIDIVISDIRMPVMSGIELLERISTDWNRTRCILLSGHADFAYAQAAIQHQTADYLLKPVSDEDVMAAVRKVTSQLKQEWEEISSHQRAVYTINENLPLLKGNLLNDILQGRRYSQDALADKMRLLHIPFESEEPFALLLIRMGEEFQQHDAYHLALLEYAVTNIAEEISKSHYHLWTCKDAHDDLVMVLKSIGDDQRGAGGESSGDETGRQRQIERIAEQLQVNVKLYLKGGISVIVGGWGSFPAHVPALYQAAVSALRKGVGTSGDLFMTLPDQSVPVPINAVQSLYEPPLLIHLFEAGRWDAACEKLESVFQELEQEWQDSTEHLFEVFHTISASLSYIAHRNGTQLHEIIGHDYEKVLSGNSFRHVKPLKEWSFRSIHAIKESMQRESRDTRVSVIQRVQEYVEHHLADISLQSIADWIGLHPVYLSKVYKQETGENISEYIFRLRMDRAALILKKGDDKVYEIAKDLGYQNVPYFIKVFKKQYGLTPQEYRENTPT